MMEKRILHKTIMLLFVTYMQILIAEKDAYAGYGDMYTGLKVGYNVPKEAFTSVKHWSMIDRNSYTTISAIDQQRSFKLESNDKFLMVEPYIIYTINETAQIEGFLRYIPQKSFFLTGQLEDSIVPNNGTLNPMKSIRMQMSSVSVGTTFTYGLDITKFIRPFIGTSVGVEYKGFSFADQSIDDVLTKECDNKCTYIVNNNTGQCGDNANTADSALCDEIFARRTNQKAKNHNINLLLMAVGGVRIQLNQTLGFTATYRIGFTGRANTPESNNLKIYLIKYSQYSPQIWQSLNAQEKSEKLAYYSMRYKEKFTQDFALGFDLRF